MKRCRTKQGELSLYYEGTSYVLDAGGMELPDALAESIKGHVNVVVEESEAEVPASESWRPMPRKKKRDEPEDE